MWRPMTPQVRAVDGRLVDGAAVAHDDDAIGEREDLVEVGADQQHRGSRGCAPP
jgi:hypothetical protein